MFGMTKSYLVHLGDHDEIRENGGTFALCGEWMTKAEGEGTAVGCRSCLRKDRAESKTSGRFDYDPNDLYSGLYEDDDDFGNPGTSMM